MITIGMSIESCIIRDVSSLGSHSVEPLSTNVLWKVSQHYLEFDLNHCQWYISNFSVVIKQLLSSNGDGPLTGLLLADSTSPLEKSSLSKANSLWTTALLLVPFKISINRRHSR